MEMLDIIDKKRLGRELTYEELAYCKAKVDSC